MGRENESKKKGRERESERLKERESFAYFAKKLKRQIEKFYNTGPGKNGEKENQNRKKLGGGEKFGIS